MGGRRRRRDVAAKQPVATTDYVDADGNVITVRDELSPGTLHELERLRSAPAASQEDRWQRRGELLFERLVTRWEIAGLPLEGQKALLARYRMAGGETRRWLRETLEQHLEHRAGERSP